jgi:hypothetical protein
LGINLISKGFLLYGDFKQLRDEMHNELVRRSKTPPSDSYIHEPVSSDYSYVEHAQKVLDDVNSGYSYGLTVNPPITNPYKVLNSGDYIMLDDMSASIEYIKSLMAMVVGVYN